MTRQHKVVAIAVGAVLLAGIGMWLIVELGVLGAVVSAALLAVGVVAYRKAGVQLLADPATASSELSTTGLPTADETVFLAVSATVHWQAAKAESQDADVAREFILEHAREVTARWRPVQYSLAQHELAARLSRPIPTSSGDLAVWATDLRLVLPDAVAEHLAKMDEMHRRGLLWEVQAANTDRIRSYLRDDALRTPASAIAWWLAHNENSVERAVQLADVLTKLSHLVSGAEEVDGAAESHQLIEAIEKLEQSARRRAAHTVADAYEQIGVATVARTLREKYNLTTLRPITDPASVFDTDADGAGQSGRAAL